MAEECAFFSSVAGSEACTLSQYLHYQTWTFQDQFFLILLLDQICPKFLLNLSFCSSFLFAPVCLYFPIREYPRNKCSVLHAAIVNLLSWNLLLPFPLYRNGNCAVPFYNNPWPCMSMHLQFTIADKIF